MLDWGCPRAFPQRDLHDACSAVKTADVVLPQLGDCPDRCRSIRETLVSRHARRASKPKLPLACGGEQARRDSVEVIDRVASRRLVILGGPGLLDLYLELTCGGPLGTRVLALDAEQLAVVTSKSCMPSTSRRCTWPTSGAPLSCSSRWYSATPPRTAIVERSTARSVVP